VLASGVHHVDIKARAPDGQWITFPTFEVRVMPGLPDVTKPAPNNPFTITAEYQYLARQAGQSISFTLGVTGGTAPYKFTIDWGDGTTLSLGRDNQSPLTISHIYTQAGKYIVAVDGKDAGGATALLQMSTVIRESVGLAVATTSGGGQLSNTISSVRNWLWVVWPVYIAVVLMTLSYWIGEQEAYQRIIARRRAAHSTVGKGKMR
jgi:PKD repeat protein